MTDTEQEGAPVTPEIQEPDVSEVLEIMQEVQQPSVSPGGITEDRLNELLEERFGKLQETLARQAQSAKDRGISANAKQINDILTRLDELKGNREALIQEADQGALLRKVAELESRLSRPAAPVAQSSNEEWRQEWTDESQKIRNDAAAKFGLELTEAEFNQVKFNNGIPFRTKGDAYAALNAALIAKAKGESISVAAVATEGGLVAKPPAPPPPPPEPKTYRQRLSEAKSDEEKRAILNEQWQEIEEARDLLAIKAELDARGVSPERLSELE